MTDRTLVRVQAASGLLFTLFLALHLVNTVLASLGPGVYNGFQRALRPIYQAPLVELALILLPLAVHIACGVTRLVRDRRVPQTWRRRLHRWSGIFLLVVIFGHVGATRGASLFAGVYPEFEGLAFTTRWLPYYFFPYYALLGAAGLYHMLNGSGVALGLLGWRAPAFFRSDRALGSVAAVGALLLLAGVLGFGGVLYAIADPLEGPYADLVARIVGLDLAGLDLGGS